MRISILRVYGEIQNGKKSNVYIARELATTLYFICAFTYNTLYKIIVRQQSIFLRLSIHVRTCIYAIITLLVINELVKARRATPSHSPSCAFIQLIAFSSSFFFFFIPRRRAQTQKPATSRVLFRKGCPS